MVEWVQLAAASATDGALVAADLVDSLGTATNVAVQRIKVGFGTDSAYTDTATNAPLPIRIEQATATVPVSVAGNISIINTATGFDVRVATTATQPVSVGTWTATGIVLMANAGTATIPVSLAAAVEIVQATATALQTLNVPFGLLADQVLAFLAVTATTAATFATSPGANNFNDLVALYVSNTSTSGVNVSIRDTSTATLFNPRLAPDGGGFVWQPAKETRQRASANPWVIVTDTAIALPGVTVTAQFQTAT